MKKKQDDETKVYLVYDEELDQFVLKKGDDCTILEVLDLKDPGTEKLISILIKALEREFVIDLTAYIKLISFMNKSTFCFKCFIILYCGSCKFCYFLFIETFFHLVLLLFLQKRSHSPKTVRSLLVVIFSSSGFSYPFSFSDNRILLLRSVRIHRSVEGKS